MKSTTNRIAQPPRRILTLLCLSLLLAPLSYSWLPRVLAGSFAASPVNVAARFKKAAVVMPAMPAQTLPTLSINNVSVPEGDSGTTNALFTVTLSSASNQPVTVNFATENAQATAGEDYTATSGMLTFNPGEPLNKMIAVPIIGDVIDELGEHFFLVLRNPTNAVIPGGEAFGVGIIDDDDSSPLPTASINDVRVAEGDSGITRAVFTATLSAPSLIRVRVFFTMTGGTATAGQDFTPFTGRFVFEPGETVDTFGAFGVQIHGDTSVEPDETFFVNLDPSGTENATIADGQGVGTIVNDDVPKSIRTLPNLQQVVIFEQTNQRVATTYAPNAPQLTTRLPDPLTDANKDFSFDDEEYYDVFYSDADGTPNPDGTFLTIEGVWRDLGLTARQFGGMNINEVELRYASVNDRGDYVSSFRFGSICNPSPDTPEQCIPGSEMRAVDNNLDTFPRFGHTSPMNLNERFRLTIGFNGLPLQSQVQFSAAGFREDEAASSAQITVTRSGDTSGAVTLSFNTSDGTAIASEDYGPISGTVTFAAGETSKTVTVPIISDAHDEPDESINLTLSNPMGGNLGSLSTAVLTITDDDPTPRLRTLVLPHVLEKSGTITNTVFTFDTQVLAVYTGGASIPPAQQSATVDLYLFDNSTSAPMRGSTGEVCNPCRFEMNQTTRERTITIDDLIVARGGGFDRSVKLGYGVIVVGGADPNGVNLQSFVVNSHTNAFDISVLGFTPEELLAPPSSSFETPRLSEFAKDGQSSTAAAITGRVLDAGGQPMSGVNVALVSFASTGTQLLFTASDTGGNYSFTNLPEGRDYMVLPLSSTFIFSPNARRFHNLSGILTADFTSTPTIGGSVRLQNGDGIDNVTMVLLKDGAPHGIAPTDEQGNYFFRGLTQGDNYTVVPLMINLTFTPRLRQIANLQSGLTAAEFMAAQATAPSVVQFGAANYDAGEADGFIRVTVSRTGDTSGPAVVEYATLDGSGSQRSDYTKVVGTLRFGSGEIAKTFDVLITDDAFVEGAVAETAHLVLSNPAGGVIVGPQSTSMLRIAENDTMPATNPTDVPAQFVENHYHDFLNRPADPAGRAFWIDQITSCGADTQCRDIRRINVSAAFFLSIEFQQTGFLVYRAHQAAFDIGPALGFREFLRDTQEIGRDVVVGQLGWEQKLEANKQAFFAEFVSRSQFLGRYPSTMTAAQYVDALNANTGGSLTQAQLDALVSGLTGGTETRASVLRAVAENGNSSAREFNRAFVFMQYLGYLRRRPNDPPDMNFDGYNFWLNKLNQFNGNFIDAEMVKAFNLASEYRVRFGP